MNYLRDSVSMNREEIYKKFENNVSYLQRNIPPDDIYVFAEQTFMAAMFFLSLWSEWVDLDEEVEKDPVVKKWATNIIALQKMKDSNLDVQIDLNLDGRRDSEIS
jgi:hypothetical protein